MIWSVQDEKYSHLEAEEMKKVEESVKKRREWMDEKSQSQSQLPKYVDPIVKISQITTEQQVRIVDLMQYVFWTPYWNACVYVISPSVEKKDPFSFSFLKVM